MVWWGFARVVPIEVEEDLDDIVLDACAICQDASARRATLRKGKNQLVRS